MSVLALVLILLAAVGHAFWNFLAKRVGGGVPFVWLFLTLSSILYAPLAVAVVIWQGAPHGPAAFLLIAASAVVHGVYFILLSRGYHAGDLSLVYPLARGTGPMWATAGAILLLGERPHLIALLGALLVVGGAVAMTGDPRRLRSHVSGLAIVLALAVGALIGCYTLIDKQAVSAVALPPLAYSWAIDTGMALLLAPHVLGRRAEVVALWRASWKESIAIAILSPLSYILVLSALVFSPVSYISPAREISVLFGAAMGARLLGEGDKLRRLTVAAVMVTGVVLLAV